MSSISRSAASVVPLSKINDGDWCCIMEQFTNRNERNVYNFDLSDSSKISSLLV